MSAKHIVPTFLTLVCALTAQEGQMPPNPLMKEHELLKRYVGTFDVSGSFKTPDGEKVSFQVTEESESTCGGLWTLGRVYGPVAGQPFEGVYVFGFDKYAKKYVMQWVDGQSTDFASGDYDAKADQLVMHGTMTLPDGTTTKKRRVVKFVDADTYTESVMVVGSDGKESEYMTLHAKRAKSAKPAATKVEASAEVDAKRTPEQAYLARFLGTHPFELTYTSGEGTGTMKGEEVATARCNGNWLVAKVVGDFGGMPFEGRLILGHDAETKTWKSYWVDSMAAYLSTSTGGLEADGKTLKMTGTGRDMTGRETKNTDVTKWNADGTRVATMTAVYADDGSPAGSMTITYRTPKKAEK
jgi:hypothetical protein